MDSLYIVLLYQLVRNILNSERSQECIDFKVHVFYFGYV